MKTRFLLPALIGISLGIKAQNETVNGNLTINGSSSSLGTNSILSTESGKTNFRLTINTLDADNSYIYNYNPTTATFHTINIGGVHSLSSGLTILGNGNIGVGTAIPNEKLQVNGNLSAFEGNITFNNSSINQVDSGTIRWNEYANSSNKSGAFVRYNGNGNYLQFMTNDENTEYEHLRINRGGNFLIQPISGNVGIGTTNPNGWKLAVNGKIRAKEIKVDTGWSDFVFNDSYNLPTLREVENHIKEKGHLKDIPSAKEVEENGIFLGEMDSKLLQKIEELTLYTIQQEKKIENLTKENEQQTILIKKLLALQKRIKELENK